jgi:C-terminal processing protease CtpA/Prc
MLARLDDAQIVLDAGFTQTHRDDRHWYAANFNKTLLDRTYLAKHEKTGPLIHTVIDSIGYVYYNSFDEDLTEADVDAVINRFREQRVRKGTVIDIRGNKGGKIENMFMLLSKIDIPDELLNTTSLIYQVAYKNGPKHDQFTPMRDVWLKESMGDRFYGSIVVLTNRDNGGNAALFASGARAISGVRVMGDTTLGYAGLTAGYELPNGWRVHYPNSLLLTGDGMPIIHGVPPTHPQKLDPAAEAQGKDSILEEALKALKEE